MRCSTSDAPFEEFQSKWAPSMVIGLGRLSGRTVGVLANNPLRLGGCLNSESAEKAARFVRLCDAFGIPLVVVVDVPGYLPGVDQEWGGVVRRGAKLLHAFGESTVPRVTLVTRKIYGGAYIAMNSRSLNATKVFAWPDAEVAVMGAKAAVGILHKKKLAAAPDHEREALHEELAAEHERIAGGVDAAIEIGVVDAKIDPAHTRSVLTQALAEAPGSPRPAQEHPAVAGDFGAISRGERREITPKSHELVGRGRPFAVGGHQSDAGTTVQDVVGGQRALMGHGVLELGADHVDTRRQPDRSDARRWRTRRPWPPPPRSGPPAMTAVPLAAPPAPPGWPAPRSAAGCGCGTGRPPTPARDRPVEHVLGHVPVLGELAADDAERTGVRFDDGMIAGDVGGAAFAGVDQRPQTRIGSDDVGGGHPEPSTVLRVSSRKSISVELACGTSGMGPGASSSVRPR